MTMQRRPSRPVWRSPGTQGGVQDHRQRDEREEPVDADGDAEQPPERERPGKRVLHRGTLATAEIVALRSVDSIIAPRSTQSSRMYHPGVKETRGMARTIVHVGRKIRVALDARSLPDGRDGPPRRRASPRRGRHAAAGRRRPRLPAAQPPAHPGLRRCGRSRPGRWSRASRSTEAAVRELAEETGYRGGELDEAGRAVPLAGRAQRGDPPVPGRGPDARRDGPGGRRDDRADTRPVASRRCPGRWTARSATPRRSSPCSGSPASARRRAARRKPAGAATYRRAYAAPLASALEATQRGFRAPG